jgi:cytochrome c peroxidase
MYRKLLTLAVAVPGLIGVFAYFHATSPSAQDKPTPGLHVNFNEKGLTPKENLGFNLFFDARLSEPAGLSCASCHDPARAFTGNNSTHIGVALGSRPGAFGFRDTPTAMYLATAPKFGSVEKEGKRMPAGGLFWDGRADTLEDQAKGPFFNPVEMNNRDPQSLIAKIASGPYAADFRKVWGERIFDNAETALDAVAASIAAFERTHAFQPFSSKFDAVMRGQAKFTEQEQRGLSLFTIRQKGNCASCHTVDEASRDPKKSLFTDFTYHALGLPRSMRIPKNATDATYHDMGLCGPFRDTTADTTPDKNAKSCGLFKVPTLRNIALTAPYMHNGLFDNLRDAVAYYATRDTDPKKWFPDGKKFNDLPPQFHANVDVETPPYQRRPEQRAQLNDDEIDDIVAFLRTLTDGYKP